MKTVQLSTLLCLLPAWSGANQEMTNVNLPAIFSDHIGPVAEQRGPRLGIFLASETITIRSG